MESGARYLWRLGGRLRGGIIAAIVAGLSWQVAAILAPLLIGHAVDAGMVHHHRGALVWSCVGIVVLGAVEAAAGGIRHYYALRNRAQADAAVRDGIFRQALELDARYHDRVGAGELISRASNDAELVARLFDSIGQTVGYLLTVVGISTVMLVIDWRLALVVLAPLPLLSIGFWRYSARYAERTRLLQEGLGGLTTLVEETAAGHPRRQGARRRRCADRTVSAALRRGRPAGRSVSRRSTRSFGRPSRRSRSSESWWCCGTARTAC